MAVTQSVPAPTQRRASLSVQLIKLSHSNYMPSSNLHKIQLF